MFDTQRLMRWGALLVGVGLWVGMYVFYMLVTPTSYTLQSHNPQIQPLLMNMYQAETATDGTQYRWSQPESTIRWSGLQYGQMAIATVQVADVGQPVLLHLNTYETNVSGQRTLTILLNNTPVDGQHSIALSAPTYEVPGDSRSLGIRVRAVGLSLVHPPTMPIIMLLSMTWLAVICAISVSMLRRQYWVIGVILAPAVSLLMTALNPLHAVQWLAGLAVVSSIVPILIFGLRRWLPIGFLAVTSATYAIRLWGVMYPPFAGHDYVIHLRRLLRFHDGATILTDNPYEFGQRVSLILPYYYYLADALSTVIGHHLALHGLMITSETALGVVVWLLLRQIGVPSRTAQLAGILTVVWPISSAVLWWSFMPQITAHVLTVVVAYAAVRLDRRGAYLAALCLVLIAAMHIGEFMVAAVWYGFLRISERDIWRREWWQRSLPVCAVIPIPLLLYWPVIQTFGSTETAPMLAQSSMSNQLDTLLPRMLMAITVAWQPIPVWVTPVVIGAAVWGLKRTGWAWLGVGVTFWLVELITQAQVRYLYTVTPLVAIGFASVLQPIWRKGRAGRLFVLCLVGFVAWVSLALWIDGVMGWQKPRIDGLTH